VFRAARHAMSLKSAGQRELGARTCNTRGTWWAFFIDSCAASIRRSLMPIDALVLLHLPSRHATAMIPPRSNRKTPIEYDREAYKRRNLIERCVNRLKQFRRIATRYEKTARAYLSMLCIAWIKTFNTA
jgi:hypothetical protein